MAYTGLGACFDQSSGEEIDCLYPTTGGGTVADYLSAWTGNEGITNTQPGDVPAVRPGLNLSAWFQQNKTAVYAGAGILVLMSLFKRRR